MFIHLEKRLFIIGEFNKIIEFIFDNFKKKSFSKIILPCSLNDLAIQNNQSNQSSYKNVDYCTSDSMLLTKYFQYKYKNKIDRVYGPDLMLAILKENNKQTANKIKHCFIAPNEESMKALSITVKTKFKKINAHFYFLPKNITKKEELIYLKKFLVRKTDVVWIGIGSPKQIEIANWIKNNYSGISIFCVGAAFDFVSGLKKQAPQWIRTNGLEWLFRLISEPARLWRRYLVIIPRYLIFSLLKKK